MSENELAAKVMEKIEADVAEIEQDIGRLEAQLPVLDAKKDEAWESYKGKTPDDDIDPEAERAYDAAWDRLNGVMQAISARKQKIERLRSPAEFDRRMDTQTRIGGLRMADQEAKAKKPTAADQGVPKEYLNDSGSFRIGMDARLKSDLVNSALGLITKEEPGQSLHIFTKAEAEKLLEARDWTPFLDRKRTIVEEKAAAQAKRQEEREAAAREKAEAKEAKAAEKKAAAEAKKADTGKASSGGSKADQDRAQREAKAGAAAS